MCGSDVKDGTFESNRICPFKIGEKTSSAARTIGRVRANFLNLFNTKFTRTKAEKSRTLSRFRTRYLFII